MPEDGEREKEKKETCGVAAVMARYLTGGI